MSLSHAVNARSIMSSITHQISSNNSFKGRRLAAAPLTPTLGARRASMSTHNSIAYFKRVWRDEAPADVILEMGHAPLNVDYSDELAIFFLIDEGESFTFVMDNQAEDSGKTLEEVLAIGISNLRLIADEVEIKKNQDFIYFTGSGNFEASLLLVDEIWDEWLSDLCPNGYIAAIPARDILAVCDKNDHEAATKLAALIGRVWDGGDHLLSNKLYTREGKKWVPLAGT